MNLINKHKNVKLIVEDSLLKKLEKLGVSSYPNECGGFLVGYYSDNNTTLQITDSILPKKQKGSSILFERSIDGVKDVFVKLFSSKKYFYIGEWHTHPNGSSLYSQTDLTAMVEIANCDTVNIENPILLILSIKKNQLNDFSIYLYNKKGLYKYE